MNFLNSFSKIIQLKYHKNHLVGAELYHSPHGTIQIDITELAVTFQNVENVPKNVKI
jgi:hypothetical protein